MNIVFRNPKHSSSSSYSLPPEPPRIKMSLSSFFHRFGRTYAVMLYLKRELSQIHKVKLWHKFRSILWCFHIVRVKKLVFVDLKLKELELFVCWVIVEVWILWFDSINFRTGDFGVVVNKNKVVWLMKTVSKDELLGWPTDCENFQTRHVAFMGCEMQATVFVEEDFLRRWWLALRRLGERGLWPYGVTWMWRTRTSFWLLEEGFIRYRQQRVYYTVTPTQMRYVFGWSKVRLAEFDDHSNHEAWSKVTPN